MSKPISVKEVIEAAGGATALADILGIDRTTPYSWQAIPPRHVRRVAEVTGYPPHHLRPDLYDAPAEREGR